MTRLSKPWGGTLLLLLSLGLVSCSRPGGAGENKEPVEQTAPFQGAPETTTAGPSDPTIAIPQDVPSRPNAVPFADPQTLAAGTLLNVRLDDAISTLGLGNDAFTAVVDEPVVVDGVTVVPRGATVEGRIESAVASQIKRNRGFVRLTLNSIEFGGRELPLQTSSLFARGRTTGTPTVQGVSATTVTLERGRRLTFRLTGPVSITNQVAKSGH